MPVGLMIIAALVAIAVTLFCLDRLALWMERKGWIYYRNLDPKVTMRGVLGGIDQFVHPEVRHVEEEKSQRKAESDQSSPSDR